MSSGYTEAINNAHKNQETKWQAARTWAAKMGYQREFADPAKSHVYSEWLMMLSRCYNLDDPGYPLEGGRGIRVCDEWNPASGGSFENFCDYMLSLWPP